MPALPTPALAPDRAQLWLVCWGEDAGDAAGLEELLTEPERHRLARMRAEETRRQFLAGRALARSLLGPLLGKHPTEVVLDEGPHGKPFVRPCEDAAAVRFSIAHTRGAAACLLAEGRDVGVDLETLRERLDPGSIAARWFTQEESARIGALPPPARLRRFLEHWTLKEAWLKATGVGIAGLSEAALREDESGRLRLAIPGGERWLVWQQWLDPELLAAVAVAPGEGPAVAVDVVRVELAQLA